MEQTVNETRFLNLRGSKPEIDELIQQIVEQATLIRLDKSDLIYLYKEQVVLKRRINSFPRTNESRMESILHELTEYASIDFGCYNKVVLLVRTSQKHPLLMEELRYIHDVIKQFPNGVEIRWGMGYDNSLDEKALLMLVCSC
jgi:cell division GTPase FtsZ